MLSGLASYIFSSIQHEFFIFFKILLYSIILIYFFEIVKQIYATPPTPIVQVKPICPPSMVARQAAIPQLMVKTLNEKGGRFMPSFMAADEATAANFPNLLPLADMDSVEVSIRVNLGSGYASVKTAMSSMVTRGPENQPEETVPTGGLIVICIQRKK